MNAKSGPAETLLTSQLGMMDTRTRSQVSAIVSGPCSLRMSKIVLVIVCVCSGGVFSSIGFILGLGFVARYRIAVANISK